MRRVLLLVVLVAAAVFPGSAFAQAPNDEPAGAIPASTNFTFQSPDPTTIPSGKDAGGWLDATPITQADSAASADPIPSCVGNVGYHSLWYTVTTHEPSVLTVTVASGDVSQFQPIVTIYPFVTGVLGNELACGLGGSNKLTQPFASASSYVGVGVFIIRVAAVSNTIDTSGGTPPTLTMTSQLRDVTPPQIMVNVPAKVVGVGQTYQFDATGSVDGGSEIDYSTIIWTYYEGNTVVTAVPVKDPLTASRDDLLGHYAWKTSGLHRVDLTMKDRAGNSSSYVFFVYVHSFVPPKVTLRVFVPAPGARFMKLQIAHNVPVNVRLVIFQGGKLLRAIPKRLVKGSHAKTTLRIALKRKVTAKDGFVTISGVASDLGTYPNTVPLLTCSVDPVNGGGDCA